MPIVSKQRVLIVDDNPANRLAFEVVLEKDFDVRLAESGLQAIELAQREEFAVILLDVRMPDMDGFETATRLRRLEGTKHTSIIFTSAVEQSQAHVYRGFSVGATDYLFSPVEPEVLKFKVSVYAEFYARDEALRAQIAQLNDVVSALRASARPADTRIRRLEGVIAEMKLQIQEPAGVS
ncbi:MAG TPA: response regulator [Planctomycetota bacterium]